MLEFAELGGDRANRVTAVGDLTQHGRFGAGVEEIGSGVADGGERAGGQRLGAVRDLLADHERSSVRLVVTPEQVGAPAWCPAKDPS